MCLSKRIDPNAKKEEYFYKLDKKALMEKNKNVTILNSRAADNLIGLLRDKSLSVEHFRFYSRRLIRLLVEESIAIESNEEIIKESPLGLYKTMKNSKSLVDDYIGVSILRSGNAMIEELIQLVPGIPIGKVLVQRDESREDKRTIFYFEKLPHNIQEKKIFILDPMLGTGGSMSATIEVLKTKGVKEENILFVNMIASLDGLNALITKYPKLRIITAEVDPILLPNKYIAPGMGDFGDRFYGTELLI